MKTVFTFTMAYARMILRLTQYAARQNHTPADTQAFLNQLVYKAYHEMEAEEAAARRIRTCPLCGKVFSGNPACPACGQWVV